MDWLQQNAWAVWLGTALVLGVVEAATVDLVFLMLAGGAAAGALAALLGLGFVGQGLVAIVVATLLLLVARPMAKRRLLAPGPTGPMGAARHVGAHATVVQTVTEDSGLVRLGGETWSARVAAGDSPAPEGCDVEVVALEGAGVLVRTTRPIQDSIEQGE